MSQTAASGGTPGQVVPTEDIEQLGINVIRGLAMDAPRKANSGHPGTAMALAPLAHVLWTRVMRYDAADPDWPNRDRFVLSPGHACILLYSMLFLTGYDLTLDDLKQFRQLARGRPGIPSPASSKESRSPPARSARASPTASGSAPPSGCSRARYGPDLIDHYTFVICGDGDLMEGISHEAASLAGHLGLGPAHLHLRRQPHHHRRADRDRPFRRRRQAVRGLRLAHREPGRGSQRHRRPRISHPRGPWRSRTGRASCNCAPTSAGRRPT